MAVILRIMVIIQASDSCGAMMKRGGRGGVFERSRVICAKDVQTEDTRIGLSTPGPLQDRFAPGITSE